MTRSKEIRALLIDERSWRREAYCRALARAGRDIRVHGYASVSDINDGNVQEDATLVMLNMEGVTLDDARSLDSIALAKDALPGLPIVVVSDSVDGAAILKLIERGIGGYLPISLAVRRVVDALRLVAAGGTFIPAEPVLASFENAPMDPSPGKETLTVDSSVAPSESREMADHDCAALISALDNLTPKEKEVLDQLREAKSNKHIARELDVSEATIKVHVGNIIKKLGVSNRTQVAVLVDCLDEELNRKSDDPDTTFGP